jgi:hypothetical protein
LKFEICVDFFPLHQVIFILTLSTFVQSASNFEGKQFPSKANLTCFFGHTWVPSLLRIKALTLSAWPLSFMSLAHDRGSQTLRTRSVDPLTITVPDGFMARL